MLSHGHVSVREDPLLGPPDPFRPTAADTAQAHPRAAAAAAARRITVVGALKHLLARDAIAKSDYTDYRATYAKALKTVTTLSGRRRAELTAVIGNLNAVAAGGGLTSTRVRLAFLTLERNRQWWISGRLLAYAERVSFGSSIIVWQSYPGQGLQVQWLGTFGKANAMWTAGSRYNVKLRGLLEEVTPLAATRNGGPAWEYWFHFDGGSPPWVSGMAQATAAQAFARASQRLKEPAFAKVSHDALKIFHAAPPLGVRVRTALGAHYLIYSFDSGMRVLNAFIQSLIGLHDVAQITDDAAAQDLYEKGLAEARVEVPRYDTGAWSFYQPGLESDLGYHTLLRDFLRGLCDRVAKDRAAAEKAGETTADDSPTVFCRTADHFTTYLKQPPTLSITSAVRSPVGRQAYVVLRVSKLSTVTLAVRRGGAVVATRTAQLGRGVHTLGWGPPVKSGAVALTLRAVDQAGNAASVSGTQTITAR